MKIEIKYDLQWAQRWVHLEVSNEIVTERNKKKPIELKKLIFISGVMDNKNISHRASSPLKLHKNLCFMYVFGEIWINMRDFHKSTRISKCRLKTDGHLSIASNC